MNRPLEWVEKREDGTKRKVRVTFFGGKLKWQFQLSGEYWVYDQEPTLADWEALVEDVKRRYQRRRSTLKELRLVEQRMKEAERLERRP